MKNLLKSFFIMLFIISMSGLLNAQPQYYNYTGSGNGTNNFPFNVSGGKDVQLLYLAGEFNQPSAAPAGNITSISLYLNNALGPATYTDLTIKLAQSTITNLTSGAFYSGTMTTVYYRSSVTISCSASSWLTFTLDTPFPYDPTQSLILDVGQCGGTGTLGGGCAYTNLSGVRRIWSVGGCPFAPYNSSSIYVYNTGFNLATNNPPTVVTTAATPVGVTTATLNGTVNANNSTTTPTFEYGLTTAYGSTAAGVPASVSGTTVTSVSANITGLTGGTLYHYRIKGVNSYGTSYGSDMTFTTLVPPPTVTTTAATNIGVSYATLNGIVNANNASTTVSFDYGLTTAYGTNVAGVPSPVTGTTNTNVSAAITGLAMSTTYHYRVNGVNSSGTSNGNDMTFLTGCPSPSVTGPSSVCVGNSGIVYTTETGMSGYVWTVSAGGTITAGAGTNSITVTWNTTGAQTVTVNYTSAGSCPATPPTSYAVTVNPLPVVTISGSATVCQYSSVTYTTQSGMTNYNWIISSGGTVTAGGTATSNTVTVTWNGAGAQTVKVSYTNANGCMPAAPTVYPVTVNNVPVPTIGSNNNPCTGSTNNVYYTESGMTNYSWSISSGGTIASGAGTSTVHVTWTGVGSQWISVSYTNAVGCPPVSPTQLPVFVSPMPNAAGPITGTETLCAGTNGVAYSTPEILNATSYTWTLPAGATIASGAGTRNITVDFGPTAASGNITVAGTSQCGNGTPSSLAVTVNPLPFAAGTITGPASVCAGDANVAYSVSPITAATTYVWTIPTGASITSGANTRNIKVTFGTTPAIGVINVKGSNACGDGQVSPDLNVEINAIPDVPVVTAAGNVLTSSAATGNQWYYNGTAISGATSQTYTVDHNTGYYWCVVTVNGCSSPISNKVWIEVTGQQELQNSGFSIYPVPNDGQFTVSITSPVQETYTISVYSQLGVNIFELGNVQVKGTLEKKIDLRPVANGVYSVVLLNSEHKVVKRILVNK